MQIICRLLGDTCSVTWNLAAFGKQRLTNIVHFVYEEYRYTYVQVTHVSSNRAKHFLPVTPISVSTVS